MSPQPVACVDRADRPDVGKTLDVERFAEADPASAVTIPSVAVRSYLQLFQCIAVCAYDDGRVSVSRDPFTVKRAPIAGVWWCSSPAQALAIKRQCEAEEISDVVSVAAGLRIGITSNAVAISRAEAAIARMDALVAQAQQAGLMRCLNARYRQERMRARDQGRSFPAYAIIHRRFVQSLLRIASGEVPNRSLVEMALGVTSDTAQPSAGGRV